MVLAHAIGGRTDLPLPLEYFVVGAALVLLLSFAALSLLWTKPRLQDGPRYAGRGVRVPVRTLSAIGVLGLVLVVGQLFVPLFGLEPDPTRPTIAPVLFWVGLWLVVPFGSALVGNWYAGLNPWRALAVIYDLGRGERAHLLERYGVWPATILLLGVVWFELISGDSGSPLMLGLVALGYTLLLLGAISYAGRETALVGIDVFTTQNRLFSAISPIGRGSTGRLTWRGWLRALPVLPDWPGSWAFVVSLIGTVTYDGASGSGWMGNLIRALGGGQAAETIMLIATVVVIGAAYLGAAAVAGRSSETATKRVAQRFAHTLVPIALAYAFAHYLTLILFEGQQIIRALSDPFGIGWDLFGTAGFRTVFFVTTSDPIWYTQVGSIVAGHVLGVVLAHDRALADFGRGAIRSQYTMLLLMIALTSLGLFVLAG
ncbi:MAG: hypothetical protein L0Z63_07240 [Actinobacteria bacterium]|nr:hypothetical protein [Actinomycetota bacterium]